MLLQLVETWLFGNNSMNGKCITKRSNKKKGLASDERIQRRTHTTTKCRKQPSKNVYEEKDNGAANHLDQYDASDDIFYDAQEELDSNDMNDSAVANAQHTNNSEDCNAPILKKRKLHNNYKLINNNETIDKVIHFHNDGDNNGDDTSDGDGVDHCDDIVNDVNSDDSISIAPQIQKRRIVRCTGLKRNATTQFDIESHKNQAKQQPISLQLPNCPNGDNGQHYRYNCLVCSPTTTETTSLLNQVHCSGCYCYVCNVPVDQCYAWSGIHCHATPYGKYGPTWTNRRLLHLQEENFDMNNTASTSNDTNKGYKNSNQKMGGCLTNLKCHAANSKCNQSATQATEKMNNRKRKQ